MHVVSSTLRIGVDMLKLLEIKVKIVNLRRKERKFEMVTYNGNKGIER